MSEPAEARAAATAPLVQMPVDLVEFEARLLAVERRLSEQEGRDQLLLAVAEALLRLTNALGPMLEAVRPLVESSHSLPRAPPPATAPVAPRPSRAPPAAMALAPSAAPPASPPAPPGAPIKAVEPERLAMAQARIRQAAGATPPPTAPTSPLLPPGRRSWLLRALRRMVARDPEAAGRLLIALLPATRLAQIEPVRRLPGPSATVARVVVRGRLRRRLGWEMAELACELATVSALARLVRLRASPAQLHTAGVRLDPPLALGLVAGAIDPRWTVGLRFTLAHLDQGATYLQVCDGARPVVKTQRFAAPVDTTVRCPADALAPLLAGELGVAATVEGERWPLEIVRRWFADATSA